MSLQNFNPHTTLMKKYVYEMLQERYLKHDDIVDRITINLSLAKDIESFGKLLADVYSAGYRKAATEYQKQLKNYGLKITEHIVDNNGPKIFPK